VCGGRKKKRAFINLLKKKIPRLDSQEEKEGKVSEKRT